MRHGKRLVGWEEIARGEPAGGDDRAALEGPGACARAVEQGASIVMSPASRTYFDLKYDESTELGTTWAGYVGVRDAYDWDPGDVLGVEAALWSETLATLADVEFMAFPRLLALAEVASVAGGATGLGGLPHAPGGARAGARGARRELLPLAGDSVALSGASSSRASA